MLIYWVCRLCIVFIPVHVAGNSRCPHGREDQLERIYQRKMRNAHQSEVQSVHVYSDAGGHVDGNPDVLFTSNVYSLTGWVDGDRGSYHLASHISYRSSSSIYSAVACPEKLGGGGGAQSNLPTRDHQNIFHLILIWSRCNHNKTFVFKNVLLTSKRSRSFIAHTCTFF